MNVGKKVPQERKEVFLRRHAKAVEWMFAGDNYKQAKKCMQTINQARTFFKYSPKTNTCDIFYSMQRSYRIMKEDGRD